MTIGPDRYRDKLDQCFFLNQIIGVTCWFDVALHNNLITKKSKAYVNEQV